MLASPLPSHISCLADHSRPWPLVQLACFQIAAKQNVMEQRSFHYFNFFPPKAGPVPLIQLSASCAACNFQWCTVHWWKHDSPMFSPSPPPPPTENSWASRSNRSMELLILSLCCGKIHGTRLSCALHLRSHQTVRWGFAVRFSRRLPSRLRILIDLAHLKRSRSVWRFMLFCLFGRQVDILKWLELLERDSSFVQIWVVGR